MPGLRTEQVDLDNFAKIFLLKKDIGLFLNNELIIKVIGSLTEEEKETLGLMPVPDARKKLKQLIEQSKELLAESVVGSDPDQYPQWAVDEFTGRIAEAETKIFGTADENEAAYKKLWQDYLDYLRAVVVEEGVELDGKWYSYTPPAEDSGLEWVPVKLLKGKYWISLVDIPPTFPNASSYVWLYGVYFGAQIYSRENHPEDLKFYPWIDGTVYQERWFGGDRLNSKELKSYLRKEIAFTWSTFPYMAANPPFIPEDGFVWVGHEEEMGLLPTTKQDLAFYFNAVAAMGK